MSRSNSKTKNEHKREEKLKSMSRSLGLASTSLRFQRLPCLEDEGERRGEEMNGIRGGEEAEAEVGLKKKMYHEEEEGNTLIWAAEK